MPWKHEWWCPICWAILLLHVALRVARFVYRVYRLLVVTPAYAVSHPAWLVVQILRILLTPIRVPFLLLLVIVYERGWNQVVWLVWWICGTPRVVTVISHLDEWWYWL